MWTCPNCERNFKTTNQSHSCTDIDIGEFFIGKPDELVLAFDFILQSVAQWEPNSVGSATRSIVFTSKKAWLIIKPMKTELDVKFYYDSPIESGVLKKVTDFYGKFAHHIRIKSPEQIDGEVLRLLRMGYEYSLR